MRSLYSPGLPLLALAMSMAGVTQPAAACSGAPCVLPSRFAVPADGVVPANLGELTVFFSEDKMFPRPGNFNVKLRAAETPSTLLLSGATETSPGSALSLGALLQPGKSYVVEAAPNCPHAAESELLAATATTTLHVSAPSEPPTTLGPLKLVRSTNATVPIAHGGSCWEDYSANVADVALDAAVLPAAWRSLITHYQLIVDGEPFNWSMSYGARDPTDSPAAFYLTGAKEFRAWTLCADPNGPGAVSLLPPLPTGLAPGKHTLWVRARVPTSPATMIESDKVEVQLRCPFCVDYCGPALPPSTPSTTVPKDNPGSSEMGSGEAAQPAPDTATSSDDPMDMEPEPVADRVEDDAAGCSASPIRRRQDAAWVLLAGAALWLIAMRLVPRNPTRSR
jgi:hypothetical protein